MRNGLQISYEKPEYEARRQEWIIGFSGVKP